MEHLPSQSPIQCVSCVYNISYLTSQWLTNFGWKEIFIIQLILYPGHEVVNVLWCWTFDGFLNCLTICPVVFVLWASRHDGAAFFCAKLCDCAVQHVDLIEEVNSWKKRQRECQVGSHEINKNDHHSLLTATHSFWSSPSGSITANLRLPDPRVAAACFIKSYWWVPSGMFFLGLNVLDERLPLRLRSKRPSAMDVNKTID